MSPNGEENSVSGKIYGHQMEIERVLAIHEAISGYKQHVKNLTDTFLDSGPWMKKVK